MSRVVGAFHADACAAPEGAFSSRATRRRSTLSPRSLSVPPARPFGTSTALLHRRSLRPLAQQRPTNSYWLNSRDSSQVGAAVFGAALPREHLSESGGTIRQAAAFTGGSGLTSPEFARTATVFIDRSPRCNSRPGMESSGVASSLQWLPGGGNEQATRATHAHHNAAGGAHAIGERGAASVDASCESERASMLSNLLEWRESPRKADADISPAHTLSNLLEWRESHCVVETELKAALGHLMTSKGRGVFGDLNRQSGPEADLDAHSMTPGAAPGDVGGRTLNVATVLLGDRRRHAGSPSRAINRRESERTPLLNERLERPSVLRRSASAPSRRPTACCSHPSSSPTTPRPAGATSQALAVQRTTIRAFHPDSPCGRRMLNLSSLPSPSDAATDGDSATVTVRPGLLPSELPRTAGVTSQALAENRVAMKAHVKASCSDGLDSDRVDVAPPFAAFEVVHTPSLQASHLPDANVDSEGLGEAWHAPIAGLATDVIAESRWGVKGGVPRGKRQNPQLSPRGAAQIAVREAAAAERILRRDQREAIASSCSSSRRGSPHPTSNSAALPIAGAVHDRLAHRDVQSAPPESAHAHRLKHSLIAPARSSPHTAEPSGLGAAAGLDASLMTPRSARLGTSFAPATRHQQQSRLQILLASPAADL